MKQLVQYNKPIQCILYLLILCTPHIYATQNTKLKKLDSTILKLNNADIASIEFDSKNSNLLNIWSIKNNLLKRNIYNIETKERSSQKEIELKLTLKYVSYFSTDYTDPYSNFIKHPIFHKLNRIVQNNNLIVPYKADFYGGKLYAYPKGNNKPIKIKGKQNISSAAIHSHEDIIAYYLQKRDDYDYYKPKLTICFIKKGKRSKKRSFTLLDNNGNPLDQGMSLRFAPNKPWIAAWNNSFLFFFDYTNKPKKKQLPTNIILNNEKEVGPIFDICFAKHKKPDFIIGTLDRILAYDSENLNQKMKQFEINDPRFIINAIGLSNNESLLVTISTRGKGMCWDFATTTPLHYFTTSDKNINHSSILSFNANDTTLAVALNYGRSHHQKNILLTLPKITADSLKRLVALVISNNNIDTSKIPKLLLQGTCLE